MIRLIALALVLATPVLAVDNGQFGDVPDNIRSWFKSVRSHNGVPCCDISDGHRTTWRGTSTGGYEVPIGEEPDGSPHWVPVPPEAIIYDAGNPTGEAVVWYVRQGAGTYYIRCFVPGGGV